MNDMSGSESSHSPGEPERRPSDDLGPREGSEEASPSRAEEDVLADLGADFWEMSSTPTELRDLPPEENAEDAVEWLDLSEEADDRQVAEKQLEERVHDEEPPSDSFDEPLTLLQEDRSDSPARIENVVEQASPLAEEESVLADLGDDFWEMTPESSEGSMLGQPSPGDQAENPGGTLDSLAGDDQRDEIENWREVLAQSKQTAPAELDDALTLPELEQTEPSARIEEVESEVPPHTEEGGSANQGTDIWEMPEETSETSFIGERSPEDQAPDLGGTFESLAVDDDQDEIGSWREVLAERDSPPAERDEALTSNSQDQTGTPARFEHLETTTATSPARRSPLPMAVKATLVVLIAAVAAEHFFYSQEHAKVQRQAQAIAMLGKSQQNVDLSKVVDTLQGQLRTIGANAKAADDRARLAEDKLRDASTELASARKRLEANQGVTAAPVTAASEKPKTPTAAVEAPESPTSDTKPVATAEATIDGLPAARKRLDAGLRGLKQSVRLSSNPESAEQARTLLETAVSEARAVLALLGDPEGESDDERTLRLDAIYQEGRALTRAGKRDEALNAYRQGVSAARTDAERDRFLTCIDDLELSAPPADGGTGQTSPRPGIHAISLLISLQADADAGPGVLKERREQAEQRLKRQASPLHYFIAGRWTLKLAEAPGNAADPTSTRRLLDEALDRFAKGLSLAIDLREKGQTFDDSEGELERRLVQGMTDVAKRLEGLPTVSTVAAPAKEKEQAEASHSKLVARLEAAEAAEKEWRNQSSSLARALGGEAAIPDDPEARTRWSRALVANATSLRAEYDRAVGARRQAEAQAAASRTELAAARESNRRAEAELRSWSEWGTMLAATLGVDPNSPRAVPAAGTTPAAFRARLLESASVRASTPAAIDDGPFDRAYLKRKESVGYYIRGLADYERGDFAGATAQFDQAIRLFPGDARYFYFRGIARSMGSPAWGLSGESEAVRDLRRGAELEAVQQPSTHDVSQALERIQFDTRRWIESFRMPVE